MNEEMEFANCIVCATEDVDLLFFLICCGSKKQICGSCYTSIVYTSYLNDELHNDRTPCPNCRAEISIPFLSLFKTESFNELQLGLNRLKELKEAARLVAEIQKFSNLYPRLYSTHLRFRKALNSFIHDKKTTYFNFHLIKKLGDSQEAYFSRLKNYFVSSDEISHLVYDTSELNRYQGISVVDPYRQHQALKPLIEVFKKARTLFLSTRDELLEQIMAISQHLYDEFNDFPIDLYKEASFLNPK